MNAGRVGSTFGPYELRALIGRGGMGEVYRAYDRRRDREVALKLLPPELARDDSYRQRFQREAQVAARLQEPHVIPIHDFGELEGTLFIDMRLVRGSDLRAMIKKAGHLPPAQAVDIVRQTGEALDAAHADGLVHRDVKPENILVLPTGFAYLADFGIASRPEDARLTTTGSAIGSFGYMGPERFSSERPGPATDIYSLGCVLHEALTGRPPFPSDSIPAVIQSHLNEQPPPASRLRPGISRRMDAVLEKALAKEPEDRYRTAAEFSAAAKAALGSDDGATTRGVPLPVAGGTAALGAARTDPQRPSTRRADTDPHDAPGDDGWAAAPQPSEPRRTSRAGAFSSAGTAGAAGGASTARGSGNAPAPVRSAPDVDHGDGSRGDGRRRGRAGWLVFLAAAVAAIAIGLGAAWMINDRNGREDDASGSPGASNSTSGTDSSSPESDPTSPSSSGEDLASPSETPTQEPPTATETVTETQTQEPTQQPGRDSWPQVLEPGSEYDWQGWQSQDAARCDGDDRAVMVARSTVSYMTICETHSGAQYYLGVRPDQAGENSIRLPGARRVDGGWEAYNTNTSNGKTTTYLITHDTLYILQDDDEQLDDAEQESLTSHTELTDRN